MPRLKAPSFSDRAEFEAGLNQIAHTQNLIAYLKARHDRRVLKLKEIYAKELAPHEAELDSLLKQAEQFANDNREALLPKDRKSNETVLVTYGWRTGNHALSTLSKWTWEKVLAKLDELNLTDYILGKPTVNKAGIIAAAKETGVLQIRDHADHFDSVIEIPLAQVGLKIEQEETFFIEPKVEEPVRVKGPEEKTS